MYDSTLPATGGFIGLGALSGSVTMLLIGFFLLAVSFALYRIVPRKEK